MSAFDVRVAILGAEHDWAARQDVASSGEQCRRRADHDIPLNMTDLRQEVLERPEFGKIRTYAMHLPIAGDERSDCVYQAVSPPPSASARRPLVLATNPCVA